MDRIPEMIGLVLLIMLYAMTWHNQPAREPVPVRRTKQEVMGGR
jgi:hypothetical protein